MARASSSCLFVLLLVAVCASLATCRPLAARFERPLLYDTDTYGILELDFLINVQMVGQRHCNTTAVADGVVKGEHYAPIFDNCGVEGQLTVSSSSVVNATIPLVRLDLVWADSYTSDAHTYQCSILWDPTVTVASPSCDVDYSHGENFYSASFLVSSWGGYVLPQVGIGFNVSLVIEDQDENVECAGWAAIDPFPASKPMDIDGYAVTADLGECDTGTLEYVIYFNTRDLTVFGVKPTWRQSVVLSGRKQSCFFEWDDPSEYTMTDETTCSDSVIWDSLSYTWSFALTSVSSSGSVFSGM